MTAPNDSVDVTEGSGTSMGAHQKNSVYHQTFIQVDENGDIAGTNKKYYVFVPKQAPAADNVYFDVFNNGTNKKLLLLSCKAIFSGAAAETGALSVDLFLQRTSTVGTGGTTASEDNSTITNMSITNHNSGNSVTSGVTGRLDPSGGATAAGNMSWCSLFTEETNAGSYVEKEMVHPDAPPEFPNGTGFRVVQGSEANTEGQVGFWAVLEEQDIA